MGSIIADELSYNRKYRGILIDERKRRQKVENKEQARGVFRMYEGIKIPFKNGTLDDPCWFCRSISEATYIADKKDYCLPTYQGFFSSSTEYHRFHYVCWDCHKGWKTQHHPYVWESPHDQHLFQGGEIPSRIYRIDGPGSRCASCQKEAICVGTNFRQPRQKDLKAWARAKEMFVADPTVFHPRCKCPALRSPPTPLQGIHRIQPSQ